MQAGVIVIRKISLVVLLCVIALGLGSTGLAQAQQPSVIVTRSINPDSVPAGGGVVTVMISINGSYGIGSVVEKLPADFSYVSGSVMPSDITVDVSGQDLTFSLVGESSFSYRVNTSSSSGQHQFPSGSQLTYGVDRDTAPVGGESSVTVEQAQQSGVIVTRSINPDSVPAGGGVVTVTIGINGSYGIGSVVEKLPADFSYVSGSVMPSDITVDVSGQDLTFPLVGESSFSYRVNTSTSSGQHRFPSGSQLTYGVDRDTATVGGESSVTVEQAQQPSVSVTRSINPDSVSAGGGVVTVTISINGAYGIGSVVEKLPADFTYVDGSVTPSDITVDVSGQDLTFSLVGESSFSYRVNTSTSSGQHRFPSGSQLTYGVDKDTATVGGESSVRVGSPQPQPTPTDTAPVFRTAPAVSVGENTTTVTAVRATDRDGDDVTYDITGGADQDKFSLTNTRVLSFTTAPDFEDPTDADTNNDYMVEVTATSGTGDRQRTATRTFTVTVTNQDEMGRVTFWRDGADATTAAIRVGDMLTGLAEDPDGNAGDMPPMADMYTQITGATWQWARSMTPTMMDSWMDIADATDAMYTVTDDDDGYYLQATAMYDDGEGDDKSAMMVTANPVIAASADACLEPLGMLPHTVSGTWASDCESEGQANNYARYYTFTLAGETRVAIYLTSGRDTYLYLRQGEGRTGTVEHDNNNVGRGSINSRIEETLPMGTYTVEATTYYRSAVTGAFTLDVRPVVRVQELGTLTETYTTPGTWSDDFVSARQAPNYARYYEFTLETPTDLRIDLTSERDTYLYLVREDGTLVEENNNVGRSINSRIVQEGLAAGTYTVEATTYYRNPVTGNFVLNIGLIR